MFGKNRQDRSDNQSYNRNAGYEDRFGSAGMRGGHRYAEFEPESYGPRRSQSYSDYSGFEGTTNRPYYGGEEGSFPYGGSYNADERGNSQQKSQQQRGEHFGKGPRGYRRSDERIREEVCDLLTHHGEIDASEVEVDVKEGVVILTGTVESRRIKRMAEDIVDDLNGVKDVRNELRVLAHDFDAESSRSFSRNNQQSRQEQSPQSSASSVRNRDKSSSRSSSSRRMSQ